MTKAATRKNLLSDLSNLDGQIQEIEFHLSTYDDTYSDADEYPFSKDDLADSLDTLKETRKRITRELKEIEKL
ncbi:MAG: hypothetical protein IJX34_02485 [Clostridia bacterium]|nr:hypothetical protein [Clostridia bacterium]